MICRKIILSILTHYFTIYATSNLLLFYLNIFLFFLSSFEFFLVPKGLTSHTHTHVHKKSGTSFARLQYLNMVISISWWVQYIQLYTKTFLFWGIAQCTRKNSSYWKFVRIVDALSLTVMNWRNMSQCYERIAVHK